MNWKQAGRIELRVPVSRDLLPRFFPKNAPKKSSPFVNWGATAGLDGHLSDRRCTFLFCHHKCKLLLQAIGDPQLHHAIKSRHRAHQCQLQLRRKFNANTRESLARPSWKVEVGEEFEEEVLNESREPGRTWKYCWGSKKEENAIMALLWIWINQSKNMRTIILYLSSRMDSRNFFISWSCK